MLNCHKIIVTIQKKSLFWVQKIGAEMKDLIFKKNKPNVYCYAHFQRPKDKGKQNSHET